MKDASFMETVHQGIRSYQGVELKDWSGPMSLGAGPLPLLSLYIRRQSETSCARLWGTPMLPVAISLCPCSLAREASHTTCVSSSHSAVAGLCWP